MSLTVHLESGGTVTLKIEAPCVNGLSNREREWLISLLHRFMSYQQGAMADGRLLIEQPPTLEGE